MFKPNCTYCHKKLQKNDSTIPFGKSNIWHENCYREHLEKSIQNVWLREIRLLKKIKISLKKVRKQMLDDFLKNCPFVFLDRTNPFSNDEHLIDITFNMSQLKKKESEE